MGDARPGCKAGQFHPAQFEGLQSTSMVITEEDDNCALSPSDGAVLSLRRFAFGKNTIV